MKNIFRPPKISTYFHHYDRKVKSLVTSSAHSSLTPKLKKPSSKLCPSHKRGYSHTPTPKEISVPINRIVVLKSNTDSFSAKLKTKKLEKIFSNSFEGKVPRKSKTLELENICENKSTHANQNRRKGQYNCTNYMPYFLVKSEMEKQRYLKALSLLKKIEVDEIDSEFFHLRGLCYLSLKQFQESLEDFLSVKQLVKNVGLEVYIGLYLSYFNLGNLDEALKTINLCLKNFPEYTQGLFFRGQLLFKLKRIDSAIKDLKRFKHPDALLLLSDCWKQKKNYEHSLKYLNRLKKYHSGVETQFALSKLKLDYKFGRFEEAVKCFTCANSEDKLYFEGIYYKSKAYFALDKLEDAEILFEEIMQKSENLKLKSRAIYKISCIKIQQNDFYGASVTLKRNVYEWVSLKKIYISELVEACYSLIQKKLTNAVKMFSDLIEKSISEHYLYKCLKFRGFCYFCMKKYEEAYADYSLAMEFEKLDVASRYNYLVSEVMIEFQKEKYSESLQMLRNPEFLKYTNVMWRVIKIYSLIFSNSEELEKHPEILDEIDLIKTPKPDSELKFLKSFMNYSFNNIETCLQQINESIKISEQNSYLQFTLRGLAFILFKIYTEAYEDFNAAINLNNHLCDLLPFRGVCSYFCGNYDMAIEDFVSLSQVTESDKRILSIYLLIMAGNLKEALNLLAEIENTLETRLLKVHCYILAENYEKATSLLEEIKDIDISNDIFIINSIAQGNINSKGPGFIFVEKYAKWYQGVALMYEQNFQGAINAFENVLDLIHLSSNSLVFQDNLILEEEHCEILYNIGLCYILKKNIVIFI